MPSAVTAAMVVSLFLTVGLNTLIKANISKGMSNFVFVAYSNLFAFVFLLLATTLRHRFVASDPKFQTTLRNMSVFKHITCLFDSFHRNRAPTPITNSIIFRIFLISLLSVSVQTLYYIGLGYSSPTLGSTMEDLVPAYTFIIAILSRMEKLDLKLRSCWAKSIGTVVSIVGALTVTLYKGLPMTNGVVSNDVILSSQPSKWLLGGFLLAISTFCGSVSLVIQTWTIKDYPEELILITISTSFSVILSFITAFVAEENPKAWILKPDMKLVCIFCSAIFVMSTRSVVYAWACRKKGAVYVAMFSPLEIVIALAMGVVFLGDALYLGSMIGAAIIAIGFYGVIWGQAREEKITCENYEISTIISSSSSEAAILLLDQSKGKSSFV